MATNLDLDDKLIEEARKLGKHKTKKSSCNRGIKTVHIVEKTTQNKRTI